MFRKAASLSFNVVVLPLRYAKLPRGKVIDNAAAGPAFGQDRCRKNPALNDRLPNPQGGPGREGRNRPCEQRAEPARFCCQGQGVEIEQGPACRILRLERGLFRGKGGHGPRPGHAGWQDGKGCAFLRAKDHLPQIGGQGRVRLDIHADAIGTVCRGNRGKADPRRTQEILQQKLNSLS